MVLIIANSLEDFNLHDIKIRFILCQCLMINIEKS